MKINDGILLIAGAMVTLAAVLSYFIDIRFIWLSVFIGINLMQLAFSKWCPLVNFLRKIGFSD